MRKNSETPSEISINETIVQNCEKPLGHSHFERRGGIKHGKNGNNTKPKGADVLEQEIQKFRQFFKMLGQSERQSLTVFLPILRKTNFAKKFSRENRKRTIERVLKNNKDRRNFFFQMKAF